MTIHDYWQHLKSLLKPDYQPAEGPPVFSNATMEAIMAMDELVDRWESLEL
ncbi:MAG: hypothetical protein VW518_00670 [Burkholderiaceae bacterium]